MPRLNFKIILYIMGLLLLCNGGFMLLSVIVSWYYNDGVTLELFSSSLLTLIIGTLLMFTTRNHSKRIDKREGYIIVTFGWIFMALSGMIPYLLSEAIPGFTNAFFETMSGYTTTGSTVLSDIEIVPKGVLFWRSLTHWIGGMHRAFCVAQMVVINFKGLYEWMLILSIKSWQELLQVTK